MRPQNRTKEAHSVFSVISPSAISVSEISSMVSQEEISQEGCCTARTSVVPALSVIRGADFGAERCADR